MILFPTLISGRGYGVILKLVASIHPLNGPIECGGFVIGLASIDTLRKNHIYMYKLYLFK